MHAGQRDNDIILQDFDENLRRSVEDGFEYIPPKEAVAALAVKYPYFILPSVLRMKDKALPKEEKEQAALKIALATADRTILFRIMDPLASEFENFYPADKEEPEMTTEQALDTFLSAYGVPDAKEEAILERLIFNPVPDYSQVLIRESQAKPQESDETPVQTHDGTACDPSPATEGSTPMPGSMLSESLAKIYIKQKRYVKAHEIISDLNLNFPEKSRYFADQLRFLKKLIYINSKK